jgi:uncharacterized peroxidase-related enzyme
MAFIDVIEPEDADDDLKAIYDELVAQRGKLARIHTIQSQHPESIMAHMELYMEVMFGKSPLKRAQREMIAVVVSAANSCEYCQLHHAEALKTYWKDEERVQQLRSDYTKAHLDRKDQLLCEYAHNLTVAPSNQNLHREGVRMMKESGWSERAILDANLITSYFNFVNRIVMGLGVEPPDEEISGYNY